MTACYWHPQSGLGSYIYVNNLAHHHYTQCANAQAMCWQGYVRSAALLPPEGTQTTMRHCLVAGSSRQKVLRPLLSSVLWYRATWRR